jgi:hypothetical protein
MKRLNNVSLKSQIHPIQTDRVSELTTVSLPHVTQVTQVQTDRVSELEALTARLIVERDFLNKLDSAVRSSQQVRALPGFMDLFQGIRQIMQGK